MWVHLANLFDKYLGFGINRIVIVQHFGENVGSGDNSMKYIKIKEVHTFFRAKLLANHLCGYIV